MGAVTDHTFEHLAPSDAMITATRRRLIRAARALKKDGTLPPGAATPEAYRLHRGGFFQAPESVPWPDVYPRQLETVLNPPVAAE